ncbi:MAG: glycosyltransferase family 39 protein [Candidatus Micrarchaeia archaeon]
MRWGYWPALYSVIFLVSFVISASQPLVGDEEQYAIAIKDVQRYGIQPYATYFGEPMFWKPPLSFAIYGIITAPIMGVLPETVALRIPSLLFVVLGAVAYYLLVKDDLGEEKTKYALLILLISLPVFGFGSRILTDIPAFAFTIIMLYALKRYAAKWNAGFLGLYAISLVIIGLTKSAAISVLAFLLSVVYLWTSGIKEHSKMLIAVLVGAITAGFIFFGYPLLLQGYGEDAYNSGLFDLIRIVTPFLDVIIYRNLPIYVFLMLPLGVVAVFFAIKNAIKSRSILFYEIWALSSLAAVISAWGFLPWYLLFFAPAFAYVVARNIEDNIIDKATIIFLVLISLALHWGVSLAFFGVRQDSKEIMDYIKYIGDEKVMLITQLSDGTVNAVYDLPYKVIVTPEIGMGRLDAKTRNITFWGVKENTTVPNNMRGLIYDYDNESLLPKFIDKLNKKDLYVPPVARTRKYWDGGFDVIIARKDYADSIKKVAPEYKVVYTTSNNVYYVFKKES